MVSNPLTGQLMLVEPGTDHVPTTAELVHAASLVPPLLVFQYASTMYGMPFPARVAFNVADVGITTNWFDYPGGTNSPVTIPIDQDNPSVFYRLVSP